MYCKTLQENIITHNNKRYCNRTHVVVEYQNNIEVLTWGA